MTFSTLSHRSLPADTTFDLAPKSMPSYFEALLRAEGLNPPQNPSRKPSPESSCHPFFAVGAPGRGVARLLLLTYHFPPSTETGAMRWEAMVRYAVDWGWEVDIVTLEPGPLDESALRRLGRLPSGCRIFGAPERSSFFQRFETFLRQVKRVLAGVGPPGTIRTPELRVGEPDSPSLAYRAEEIFRLPPSRRQMLRAYFAWREFVILRPWCAEALKLGVRLTGGTRYDAIITCGPPHQAHTVGAELSRRTGLPLILDLRDPWSLQQVLPDFRASKLWYQLAARHERIAVQQASVIALNTEPCRDAMRARYPSKAGAMIVATNGYDEREHVPPIGHTDGRFRIAYAGSLYFVYEHPRPFFMGVAQLVQELKLSPAELELEFIGHCGHYEGEAIEKIADSAGLRGYFQFRPHQPRAEILPRLACADVLVSLAQFNDFAIPSKIFDYLRFHAWLLVIAKPGTATDILLRGTGADLVPDNNAQMIFEALRARYREFVAGVRPRPLAPQTRSSRREQAAVFFEAVRQALPALGGN